MEGVDHVDVFQVSCCCFISDIYRMFQRNAPDWECLEFCIADISSSLIVMVQLRQACRKFAGSAARSCYNYQRFCYLDVWICTITFITYDSLNVCRITLSESVFICLDASALQLVNEHIYRRAVVFVSCYYDTVDFQIIFTECVDETQYFQVIRDTKVSTCFAGCDVS